MPEYDAFGREIGEDTLADWRHGSGAPPPPQVERAAPQQVEPAAPPPVVRRAPAARDPAPRRRRRRRGTRLGLLLVLLWVGFHLVGTLAGKVEDASRTIPVPNLDPPGPAEPPAGVDAGSLLRPAAFKRAVAEIRRKNAGRLEHLRVAPERIDATLITRRGTLVSVQVSATEGYRRFSESGPGFTATDTIPYGRLDPRAPERLTRAAAERLGKPSAQIDYLVPSVSDGKVVWGAYFKTGAIFLADGRGRITRRVS